MPLTQNQITTIEGTISYLFTPSSAQKYKEMFYSEFKPSADDEVTYQQLQEFIKDPEKFFGPLEEENPDITQGEIITAIAKYATKGIEWSEAEITYKLTEIMGIRFFAKYEHIVEEAEEELPSYNSDQYMHRVAFNTQEKKDSDGANHQETIMTLSIDFEDGTHIQEEKIHIPPPSQNIDEEIFYEEKAEEAKLLAAAAIINHFFENKNASKLLSLRYYYKLLNQDASILNIIKNIDDTQYKVLSSIYVIQLFEKGVSTPAAAIHFNLYLLSIIEDPFYHSKFLDRSLNAEHFPDMTPEISAMYRSVPVKKLIAAGKATVLGARNTITPAHVEFLHIEDHFNSIITGEIPYDNFLSWSHNQLLNLCLPISIHYLKQGIKKRNEILKLKFTNPERAILKTTIVTELIKEKKLTIHAACKLKTTKCGLQLLDQHTFIKTAKDDKGALPLLAKATEEEFANLTTRVISYFIETQRVSLATAKKLKMTSDCRAFFNDEDVLNYAKTNPFEYESCLAISSWQYKTYEIIKRELRDKINFKAIIIIFKNALLAELVRRREIHINDVLFITPSKSIFIPVFAQDLYAGARYIFKEAIVLAKQGLLFEEDFTGIYQLVSDSFKCNSLPHWDDIDEAKCKPETAKILLGNCHSEYIVSDRISKRLENLQEDKPTVFPDGEPDSIRRLIYNMSRFSRISMTDWGDVYASRLFRLYQNKPYQLAETGDSFKLVKQEITVFNEKNNSRDEFYNHVLEKLLILIVEQLQTMSLSKSELRNFFIEANKEFNATANTISAHRLKSWQKCFINFSIQAQEKLSDLERKSTERPTKKTHSLTLFAPTTDTTIENVCKNIVNFVDELRNIDLLPKLSAPSSSSSLGAAMNTSDDSASRKRKR